MGLRPRLIVFSVLAIVVLCSLERVTRGSVTVRPFFLFDAQPENVSDPIRYNRARAAGLLRWKDFLTKDHLVGFKQAHIVNSICDKLEDHEEKQMCRKRGRRIGEALIQHYPKPLTSHDARVAQNSTRKNYWFTPRITISRGKVVGWTRGHGFGGLEEMKVAYLVATLRGLTRQGLLNYSATVDVVAKVSDRCPKDIYSYPVTFVAGHRNCPHVVPLMGVHLQQWTGFSLKRPAKPYSELKNDMYFRASPYNAHRWDVFLTSATGVFPWLDARGYQRGRHIRMKKCLKHLPSFLGLNLTFLNGSLPMKHPTHDKKGQPNEELCRLAQQTDRVPFDDMLEHKYQLLVDGFATCFRLLGVMEGPGVPVLVQQTGTHSSYTKDMFPFVHYLPVIPNRSRMLVDLNSTYHWAESNPSVTESIAEESTRFVRMHASPRAQGIDWALYYAFLVYLHVPEEKDPEAGKYLEDHPKPCGAADFFSNDHFPFLDWKPYHKEKMYNVACVDNLGLPQTVPY